MYLDGQHHMKYLDPEASHPRKGATAHCRAMGRTSPVRQHNPLVYHPQAVGWCREQASLSTSAPTWESLETK
jgi:hypothetical protein